MHTTLAIYYTLLYIVFTKGFRELGKGISLVVFDEGPLVKHLMKVFGVDRLVEIQRDVFRFLEENVERLQSHYTREALLGEFEQKMGVEILAELLSIIKFRFEHAPLSRATRILELYTELQNALELLEKIKHGYSIVRTAGVCSSLVKPQSYEGLKLLDTLSRIGLAIHLPKGYDYLVEEFSQDDHFIVPCIALQGNTVARIRDLLNEAIKQNHSVIQKVIEELGRALGYETRSELYLEIPSFRLDVAWMKSGSLVKAFEVQFMLSKEKVLNAFYNLKKARREGAEIYLVVPHRHAVEYVKSLVREDPELEKDLNILVVDQLIKLYEAVKENRAVVSLLR